MNRLITFGGRAYDNTIRRIVEAAPGFGVDETVVYDDRWLLDSDFYHINRDWWGIRDSKYDLPNRGFGWFIWKPYVILHALARCQQGDVVLYVDADTYPIADLRVLFETCKTEDGAMFFEAQGCNHDHWCKSDTFTVMGERYRLMGAGVQHVVARFMLIQAGAWKPLQLLIEWQAYCLNRFANTFDVSALTAENYRLREPRCEQAILTNLVHKYGYIPHREACQSGEGELTQDRDLYPQLFFQDGNCGDKGELRGSAFRHEYGPKGL